ncbi:hypothetical protein EJ02DRAFT_404992 [Clathrospora elynae]|uniref:Uncharacterized protein n=1 Tax=Clathrospora elynae TaxID=706981 RepID=A0A6A5SKX2_9PLEO|nr:hypothetical protein EJ02DRAFT_404992 [Clathrospora elynae]
MNQNFLGAPDKDDLRLLDQLRRQLIPMISTMDRLQIDMQMRMSRGEAVDWPHIHRTTSLVTSYLSSIQMLIHGGYKHVRETRTSIIQIPAKDAKTGAPLYEDDGVTPSLIDRKVSRKVVETVPQKSNAAVLRALHPFPNTLFPMTMGGGAGAGMAGTLLRKRLEPAEEGWVEERLRKAGEWCYVPAEWGVEPKKASATATTKNKDDEEGDGEVHASEADEEIPTTRVHAPLSEDDIIELWRCAHQEVFDPKYLQRTYGGGDDEGDEEGNEGEEGEEDEEEEFEDAMDTSGAPEEVKEEVQEEKPTLPVSALGVMHMFTGTGEAVGL